MAKRIRLVHEKECSLGDILNGREAAAMGTTMYAVFDGTEALYVGRSYDCGQRICQHVKRQSWFGLMVAQNFPASEDWIVRFYTPAQVRPLVVAAASPYVLASFDRILSFNDKMGATQQWGEAVLIRYLRPAYNVHHNF